MHNDCNCCFTDYLAKCETEIVVNAHLGVETEYKWVITDKFDNKYEGLATTNASGQLVIPVADLPDGMLNQHSGIFTIQVFPADANEFCHPEQLKMVSYHTCIEFTIKGGTMEKNRLGCLISEP